MENLARYIARGASEKRTTRMGGISNRGIYLMMFPKTAKGAKVVVCPDAAYIVAPFSLTHKGDLSIVLPLRSNVFTGGLLHFETAVAGSRTAISSAHTEATGDRHNAVHAGMTGRINMVVGFWKNQLTHVHIPRAVSKRKQIDPNGGFRSNVPSCTGQPREMI